MDATDLDLRTPCCKRKVRGAPIMQHATQCLRRTCPKCRCGYSLIVRPSLPLTILGHGGNWATQLDWTPLSRR